MKRSTIITLLLIAGFGALLFYNTVSAQKAECSVCVEYNGHSNCATASHESETEAKRAAQNTACGPITSGMNESIACDRTPPRSAQCKTK